MSMMAVSFQIAPEELTIKQKYTPTPTKKKKHPKTMQVFIKYAVFV